MSWTPRENLDVVSVVVLPTRHNHRKVLYSDGTADLVPETDYLSVESDVLSKIQKTDIEATGATIGARVWVVSDASKRDQIRPLLSRGDFVRLGARRFEVQADGSLAEYAKV